MILAYTVVSISLHRVFHLFERAGTLGLEVVNSFLVNFFCVSIFLMISAVYQLSSIGLKMKELNSS
jgi:hypothetical protein